MAEPKHTNALARETSPYLLQHAHNPVQWYPWADEALQRAQREDKPILLSIGYSACHWCHVMERESFENEAIAGLMNENFVNIKVDREERPDLDAIYMAAVQMMTGSGGWPMTVFLTPEQVPFYGGTYFPPQDRQGMPGFARILSSVIQAYRERKDEIHKNADSVIEALRQAQAPGSGNGKLTEEALNEAAAQLLAGYDHRNGGFGRAPKFPPSMVLSFLLRSYLRSGDGRLLEAVEQTLQKMACGGIYDQLGGGFHRYSVDSRWLVPHFEKMLYDNALLSRIYLDAYLLTRDGFYRRIAEETLDYVRREMTSPEGGFYSAQDADSEGREGKFFIWAQAEVAAVIDEGDAELFSRYYDVTEAGNFEGENILNVPRPASLVARLNSVSEERLREILARGRKLLFEKREKRIKPFRDEKILTGWNGLMLRSFAEAALGLDRDDYRQAAVRNAEFLLSRLRRGDRLLRSFKDGRARFNGYLEDYANVIDGLLSLYEATFDPRWMREAGALAEVLAAGFWDAEAGSFYFTSEDHEELIDRPRDFYDNATPSGNSAAAHALLRLGKFSGESRWLDFSRSILEGMAAPMTQHPSAFGNLLCAADSLLGNFLEIAIAGDPASAQTKPLLDQIFRRYLPNKIVACGTGGDSFLLKDRPQIRERPTVYICRNSVCTAPLTSAQDLAAELPAHNRHTGNE